MKDNKIRRQIFKTDDFYVENKLEKKLNLVRKSELIFGNIANSIDLKNKQKEKEKRRKRNSKKQRERRIERRICYYEFLLKDKTYQIKKVEKENLPNNLNLNKNDYILLSDNSGLYRGKKVDLIEFLDSFNK